MLRNIYAYLNLFQLTFWKDFRTLWKLNLPLSKLWPQAIGTLTLSKLASRRFSVKSAISGSRARMPWQSTYLYTRARPNVNTARLHSPPFPTLTSTWESITVTWMCYLTTMIRKCTFEKVENKAFNKLSSIEFQFFFHWFNFSYSQAVVGFRRLHLLPPSVISVTRCSRTEMPTRITYPPMRVRPYASTVENSFQAPQTLTNISGRITSSALIWSHTRLWTSFLEIKLPHQQECSFQ